MNKEARQAYEILQEKNRRRARQANLAIAEGWVHTSRGKTFYEAGVGKRRGKPKETIIYSKEGPKRK